MAAFLRGFALALALVFAFAAPGLAAPKFPALTGRVVDEAHLLSAQQVTELTQKLEDLEQRTSRQLVVVTLPSLQGYEIEEFGYQLGRAWGIGQAKLNNGALLIVAPTERRVRIEVGYGLEGVLTDALSHMILEERVLPRFRDGDMAGGIVSGADAIIEQLLLDAPEAKARVAAAEKRGAPQFDPALLLFIGFIVFAVLGRVFGGRRSLAALPWIILSGMASGGGGRSSGGFGGFGGGGGSFGGGGASGRW